MSKRKVFFVVWAIAFLGCLVGAIAVMPAMAEEPVVESSAIGDIAEDAVAVIDDAAEVWGQFTEWWNAWSPAIIGFVTSGAFASMMAFVIKTIITKFVAQTRTASVTEADKAEIAKRITENIVSKTITIDPSTAVSEEVRAEIEDVKNAVMALALMLKNSQEATGIMAQGIARSKLLSEDEQTALSTLGKRLAEIKAEPEKAVALAIEQAEKEVSTTIV